MKVTYSGTDVGKITLTDLGGLPEDGGQNVALDNGESVTLRDTDAVLNSLGRTAGQLNIWAVQNANLVITAGGAQPNIEVVAGTNASALALAGTPRVVLAIVAFVTSGGASAGLLALTTDYTVASGVVTTVTNQAANTLIVMYEE